ncbi:MAG: VOC family protein [Rhodobacteraceae bacterium]|nr:VOC family protein [Paracoccaceae bacterium]
MTTFDHIALIAPTLAAGAAHLHSTTGLSLPPGGEHPQMGTHNLLTTFADDTYFEIIAPNPSAPKPDRPRWFGLDAPPTPPRLAWLLRSDDIDATLAKAAKAGVNLGTATPLKRDTLNWRFSLRDDGTLPLDGAAPLIIQWDTPGPHPSNNMADLGLRLDHLAIETPHAETLAVLFEALDLTSPPRFQRSENPRITAHLTLPDGSKAVLS